MPIPETDDIALHASLEQRMKQYNIILAYGTIIFPENFKILKCETCISFKHM
jgi:hypothetical protein